MAIVKNNPQDESAPGPSKKEEKRYITIRNLEALGMLETEPPAPAPFEYGAWYVRPPHWERRDGYYQSLAKLHSSPPQDRIRHY